MRRHQPQQVSPRRRPFIRAWPGALLCPRPAVRSRLVQASEMPLTVRCCGKFALTLVSSVTGDDTEYWDFQHREVTKKDLGHTCRECRKPFSKLGEPLTERHGRPYYPNPNPNPNPNFDGKAWCTDLTAVSCLLLQWLCRPKITESVFSPQGKTPRNSIRCRAEFEGDHQDAYRGTF